MMMVMIVSKIVKIKIKVFDQLPEKRQDKQAKEKKR